MHVGVVRSPPRPAPRAYIVLAALPALLNTAVRSGDASAVHGLLEQGASPHTPEENGATPLHLAAWSGSVSIAAVLLSAGATIEVKLSDGSTPMHLAAVAGSADVLELMLAFGGSADVRDHAGQTPLHSAAAAGEWEACAACLEAGADIDAVDVHGFTPLRWAILNGHASAASGLCAAGADCTAPLAGMTPLMLASATGKAGVVGALLDVGLPPAPGAEEIARSMGHTEVLELLRAAADGALMAVSNDDDSAAACDRLMSPPVSPPAPAEIREADELTLDTWRRTFDESTPLLVRGIGRRWSDIVRTWDAAELRRRWGRHSVEVTFSADAQYQRPVRRGGADDARGYELCEGPRATMAFGEFIDLLPTSDSPTADGAGGARVEHCAVQQHACTSLEVFEGLPAARTLLRDVLGEADGRRRVRKSNLWVCAPPKLSALHYDADDSILVQLSGSKRVTLIDPTPLHGLTTYPSVLNVSDIARLGPGRYEYAPADAAGRSVTHFPLVNVSHPDYDRHPLYRHARAVTVDVPEGSALVLPAYWYHQVESFAPPNGGLNVAINYWLEDEGEADDGGDSGVLTEDCRTDSGEVDSVARARAFMHRVLRTKLRVDCTT